MTLLNAILLNPLLWVVAIFLGLPVLLWCLYVVGIQFERVALGGSRWWYCVLPVTFVALLLDVLLNYTVLVVLTWDVPRVGEWTFSDRLARLKRPPTPFPLRSHAITVSEKWLDPWAPSKRHIK